MGLLESLLEAGFEAPSWESWSLSGCYPKGMRFNAWLDLLGSVSDDKKKGNAHFFCILWEKMCHVKVK